MPTTAPSQIPCTLMGFENPDEARALASAVGEVIQVVGERMDVSGVSGITIGMDYDAALASVDRGREGLRPLSRTTGEEIAGVAMSVAVLRNGVVRSHLVLSAQFITPLMGEVGPEWRRAVYLIAHECAHAAERTARDRKWPGIILQHRLPSFEEAVLFQPAEAIWDEYVATRLSAVFGSDETEADYRLGLQSLVGPAVQRSIDAIKAYRIHADTHRLVAEAGAPLAAALRAAAYLAGHLDGLGRDGLAEMAEELALDEVLGPLMVEVVTAVRAMWDTREDWVDLAVFDGLKAVVRSALEEVGIYLRSDIDGSCWVDVPFRAETMPN